MSKLNCKRAVQVLVVIVLFSVWLYIYEEASAEGSWFAKTRFSVVPEKKFGPVRLASRDNEIADDVSESEEDFMRRIEQRMRKRKEKLTEACRQLGLQNETVEILRISLSTKYKLAYCFIPKSGCTNMKRIVLELNGYHNLTSHQIHKTARVFINTGRKMPDIVEVYNFTRLIIVRHPYERLVSAYNNKIAPTKLPSFSDRSQEMRKSYGNESRIHENGKSASFEEFIDYIGDGHNHDVRHGVDNHWNTFNSICHPCVINYDVIAHLETIEEDSRYFLQLIGAPPGMTYQGGYTKTGDPKTSQTLMESFFNKLNSSQMEKIYAAYKIDFKLFDYTVDI